MRCQPKPLHTWMEVFSTVLAALLAVGVAIASFFYEAMVFVSDKVASKERSERPPVANSISAGDEEIFAERCKRCCV
jgi:hypothetical protein